MFTTSDGSRQALDRVRLRPRGAGPGLPRRATRGFTHVAHTTPEANHLTDTIEVDGQTVDVVALDGIDRPDMEGEFFLGADTNGRDVMVRLLYGGRNSLLIGLFAALITTVLGLLLGLVAGLRRGWIDAVISRGLEVLWAFPVILLGDCAGRGAGAGRIKIGPFPAIEAGSLLIPIGVISVVYLPLSGATGTRYRSSRCESATSCRPRSGLGMSPWRRDGREMADLRG